MKKTQRTIRLTVAERAFNIVNAVVLFLIMLVTLYPFWYVVVSSFSSISHLIKNGFVLWPDGIHWEAYQQVFRNELIPTAYRNTLIITIGGTLLSMALTMELRSMARLRASRSPALAHGRRRSVLKPT